MEFKENVSLKNYTTFKIGGPAKYFYIAKTEKDLILAIKMAKKKRLPFFILGGGSNLLFSDEGFDGLVIKIQDTKYKIEGTKIVTGAGTILGELINASVKAGLSGLEWAAGLPGTVGGAIRGNAGAFGKSISNIIKTITIFQSSEVKPQEISNLKRQECDFKYRDSIFKRNKNLIIISAVFQLKKGNKDEIKKKIKEHLNYRKECQPLDFPSAGSIFKNPSGHFTGELIEKCGLKGKRIGDVKISEKQANFIVNLGKGKAKDVKKLINLARQEVKSKFGIVLEEEIEII